MNIQSEQRNISAPGKNIAPKHGYSAGKGHQPKHIAELPKEGNRGIAAFVVAFLFLAGIVFLGRYAVLFLPLCVVSTVLSICAAAKRSTFFSVTALAASVIAAVFTATMTVLTAAEYLLDTAAISFFTYFS